MFGEIVRYFNFLETSDENLDGEKQMAEWRKWRYAIEYPNRKRTANGDRDDAWSETVEGTFRGGSSCVAATAMRTTSGSC